MTIDAYAVGCSTMAGDPCGINYLDYETNDFTGPLAIFVKKDAAGKYLEEHKEYINKKLNGKFVDTNFVFPVKILFDDETKEDG